MSAKVSVLKVLCCVFEAFVLGKRLCNSRVYLFIEQS